MAELPALADLLELENDEELAGLVEPVTGVAAWPAIRNDVIRKYLGDLLYPTAPLVDPGRRPSASRIVRTALRSVPWSLSHRPMRSEVLIMATGSGLRIVGDRAMNTYTDPLAEALGHRSWTYEATYEDRWPGRRSNSRLTLGALDRLAFAARWARPVRSEHGSLAKALIGIVRARAQSELGRPMSQEFALAMESLTERRLSAYGLVSSQVSRLFDLADPRLLLIQQGCYGHRAVVNTVAHRRGLVVAELQHGMITRGHDAYNVAPAMTASDWYRRSQPDTLLTYGDWWSSQVTAPVSAMVPIGDPRTADPASATRDSHRVLLIGDGIETGWYLDMAARLQRAVGDRSSVLYRPHPLERSRLSEMRVSVEIDHEPDVQVSLGRARAVVAEASTVLFQAIGITRTIALDTPKSRFYLGDHPFERLAEPEGLLPLLDAGPPSHGPERAQFWAPDWRERFIRFVDDVVAH
jgi:hypothetical protein